MATGVFKKIFWGGCELQYFNQQLLRLFVTSCPACLEPGEGQAFHFYPPAFHWHTFEQLSLGKSIMLKS